MKKSTLIWAILTIGTLLAAPLQATESEIVDTDEILARIAPVGNVCIEGDECSMAAPAPAVAATATSEASGARSGEDVYNASCSACHSSGVAGAPIYGTADWAEKGKKGIDSLLSTALSGINAMPPKGTCADCSDDELKSAIEYMVSSAK